MPATFRHHTDLFVICLTTLLAFQAVGWIMAWDITQMEVRASVESTLAQNNTPVSSLTLAASALPAIRVGKKEIRLDGRLYDIRSMHQEGDSVRLELYHDKKEEHLVKILDWMLFSGGNESSSGNSIPIWFAKWLGASFLMPSQPSCPTFASALPPVVANFAFLSRAAQAIPGTFSPPPESGFIAGNFCE